MGEAAAARRGSAMVAVGNELLGGFTQDTNSALFARRARETGYPLRRIVVVGDEPEAIAGAVRDLCGDGEVARIMVCGGIGPTPDDITHEAVARALGREVELNPVALELIEGRLTALQAAARTFSEAAVTASHRAACIAQGAEVLPNPAGMSPPIAVALTAERWLFVLPGIPREFSACLEEVVIPRYFQDGAAEAVVEVEFHGVPEAALAEPLRRLGAEFPQVKAGSYPQIQRRHLLIRLQSSDGAALQAAADRLRALVPQTP